MHYTSSVAWQLLRGALALPCVVGAYWFSPQHMAALWLLAPAVLLLGGCPVCWLAGLLRAIDGPRPEASKPPAAARDAPGTPPADDNAHPFPSTP